VNDSVEHYEKYRLFEDAMSSIAFQCEDEKIHVSVFSDKM
jgi:hypothetical protein